MIEQRKLGKNGPEVSAIVLGSRSMSNDKAVKKAENSQTIDTIQATADADINFLNTADFYSMGENEMLIGKAIKAGGTKYLLA